MHSENGTPIAHLRPHKKAIAEFKVNNALRTTFPDLPISTIETLAEQFVALGSSQVDMGSLIDKIVRADGGSHNRVRNMIERGFKPEQIHLFVHSNPEDRNELAKLWQKPLAERMREVATQAPNTVQVATTVGLVGGAMGCLLFLGAGLIANDGSVAETGRILLGVLSDPPIGMDGSDLARHSTDSVLASGASISFGAALLSLCLKSSLAFANELLKDDPQVGLTNTRRDLEDRVTGVFSRMGTDFFPTPKGAIERKHVENELGVVPDAYLPLLKHFTPRELVAFLVSNDDAREQMMHVHPPKPEQQVETVRSLHSGKMRRAWETARQSLTAWEGTLARTPGITLKSTMSSLREARNARIASTSTINRVPSLR